MAVATFLSVEAYSYSFNNTPISEALVRISKDHPDVNISFIYKELDNYRTSARINTDDAYRALRQIVGLHPISVINKNGSFYIEALQHGRFVYTGKVIGSDNEPVAGATVMLLNPNDSTLITYGIANGEGRFTIPCDRMDVIAKLSCIGYNTVYTRSSGFNLGTIVMPVNTIMLQQVSISSTKPFVKLKGTGFSIDIANSPLGDLPTVPDVLSQLPSVKATGSGFSVLGRGDAEIFIGNQKVVDMSELYRLRPAEIKSVFISFAQAGNISTDMRPRRGTRCCVRGIPMIFPIHLDIMILRQVWDISGCITISRKRAGLIRIIRCTRHRILSTKGNIRLQCFSLTMIINLVSGIRIFQHI